MLSPFSPIKYPTADIWRTLKSIEWTLLIVTVISIAIRPSFYNSTISVATSTLTISSLLLLSLTPPIDKPLLWRRAYILIEIGIAQVGDGIHGLFALLTYFSLLKACLLLSKHDVIRSAILSGCLMTVGTVIRSPTNNILVRQYGVEPFLNLPKILIGNGVTYFAICVFVLLTGFLWTEEQRSRQRAENLTQQVETLAADLERNRIARDIHDSLGHSLTTLDVQLELAQNLYDQNPQRAAESIDIAKQLSSKCLQDVRHALRSIHRSDFDLDLALLTLIEQFKHNRDFKIHYHFDIPYLPIQVRHQLYCVVQESLTNIEKYARASQVTLSGSTNHDGLAMTIEDNGIGFDIQLVRAGFGLQNMRDRILSLGGQFNIQSCSTFGTKVSVFIPL